MTPLQKSIADIEAKIREMTGADYVAGICINILTANLEYERDVICKAPQNKCQNCDGEGGSVHPDGLSAEECTKCKGTGHIKIYTSCQPK